MAVQPIMSNNTPPRNSDLAEARKYDQSDETASLRGEVDDLRRVVAAQRTELQALRSSLQSYQRDVDQSILYLAQVSNDRWNRANQLFAEVKQRIDRYLSIGPFRILRGIRRRLLRLP